ncbi:hypothetical protein SAMN05216553_12539 [Lentzea fradiae]|uniref:Uncharacterized protein n=1 Tax=Lentzea fradiae TaxID=200378 RepID=A0A1G8CZS9_9PSEU|nr:hypothetical protein [Lentzea fradiae]SDH50794.1 hypothetical protein SAMN05216553_12539 [Lentzea fradiae]
MKTFTSKRPTFPVRLGAVTAVALLALAGTAGATTCTPVGNWTGHVTRTDGDHPTTLSFKANGSVFITNEQNTTTKGSWWPTGTNKFHFRFRGEKIYDENGAYFAYVDFDQDAVQSGPNSVTSAGPSTFFLADGTDLGTSTVSFTLTRG